MSEAEGTMLILLAHGSSEPGWGEPLRALQAALRVAAPALPVRLAALKGGETIAEALAACARAGAVRVVVAPVFFSAGGHVLRDLPRLLAEAAAAQPGLAVECAAPLGEQPEVITAMAQACRRLALG